MLVAKCVEFHVPAANQKRLKQRRRHLRRHRRHRRQCFNSLWLLQPNSLLLLMLLLL